MPGEDAVERELAPPVRVRVEGLSLPDPDAAREVRVEVVRTRLVGPAVVAVAVLERSSACSRARTR
ncbi:MAG TPA: hypothetical protein VFC13_16505, partial [Actinomycetes bacterium]|nr:hypothetical protein [Actinomycetes bacterium]